MKTPRWLKSLLSPRTSFLDQLAEDIQDRRIPIFSSDLSGVKSVRAINPEVDSPARFEFVVTIEAEGFDFAETAAALTAYLSQQIGGDVTHNASSTEGTEIIFTCPAAAKERVMHEMRELIRGTQPGEGRST